MKITPEHFERLKAVIADCGADENNAHTRQVYKDAGYSDMRYRWDLLWACKRRNRATVTTLIDEIYKYANDTHIDTALKKIVAPLN